MGNDLFVFLNQTGQGTAHETAAHEIGHVVYQNVSLGCDGGKHHCTNGNLMYESRSGVHLDVGQWNDIDRIPPIP